MRRNIFHFLLFIYICTIPGLWAQSQTCNETNLKAEAINVFLDVSGEYKTYIKSEIKFVNYVRDRSQAQVYVMMTQQETGAGGREYTIHLMGQKEFSTINDTLKYVSVQTASEDEKRRGIVRALKMGLMRYVHKTPLADYIDIHYSRQETTTIRDKWNFYVFNIDVDWDFDGEESRKEYNLEATFSIDRVTPKSKFALSLSNEYDEEHFTLDDVTLTSVRRSREIEGMYVKSLTEHWSIGVYGEISSSTYSNIDLAGEIGPAVEYNIFPYSEYTRREFRINYRPIYKYSDYKKMTIYRKMTETLFHESLSATFELKEPWGSLSSTLEGCHYLHDLSKNRVEFYCNLNFHLFEGFSLDIFGDISMIRDQLSLPAEEATQEEILLRQTEIATNYDYFISLGFRYTFGSIYSNVVNPRFGD